jgi:putative copper export protein
MDAFTLAIWVGTLIFLGISLAKDKVKTKQALKMALGMGKGMAASILSIIFAIGLILTCCRPLILPPL